MAPSPADTPIRILLVQADTSFRSVLEDGLNSNRNVQFVIEQETTLATATSRLPQEVCDLVLLDLDLPDASGLATIDRVHQTAPTLPIVVLTGLEDERLELEALQAGAQDILSKDHPDGRLYSRAIRYAVERKRAEVNLAYMAQHDQLTGLVNRTLFRVCLEKAISRASRSDRMIAMMLVDLDRFKVINDTFGQDAGDQLLKAVADRLKGCVRTGDTVGRLGNDEFTVLVEGVRTTRDIARVAQKLLSVMEVPYVLAGETVVVTPSIGVAMSDGEQGDASTLTKAADTAMCRAKESGGNAFRFFTPEMHVAVANRLSLERDLRKAIERDELVLHYQPQVDLVSGDVVGMEALVRWRRGSDEQLVPPGHFIPIAEETGLIEPIGEWVLRTACSDNSSWAKNGVGPLRVSVNLSVRQLRPDQLARTVKEALRSSGLSPELLELEVTESLLMDDVDAARVALGELKELGVRISVDDFGTGYSSMNYLKRFPIDTLKIDQTFVREVPADPDDTAITTAIIALGHGLRMDVVAEGVETEVQLEFLKEQGCDRAQGYLMTRPIPPMDFENWVTARRHQDS